MKRILLTTDLSDESKVAFSIACQQAKVFGAEIILMFLMENPAQIAVTYSMDFPVFPDPALQQQAKEKIELELQELQKSYLKDISSRIEVLAAKTSIHLEIIEYAKNNAVDLIVMATHGRTGLSRVLIGSVAERVVRESPCPVLTVPEVK